MGIHKNGLTLVIRILRMTLLVTLQEQRTTASPVGEKNAQLFLCLVAHFLIISYANESMGKG